MRQNEMHNQRCVVEFAVEVKDGGVGCPIASDSINIRIAN